MAHINDVIDFQEKLGQWKRGNIRHLTQRKLQERMELLQEELNEFGDASRAQDMAEQADALVDLVYVALGTANMLGLPWEELWADVHRANMAKQRGVGKRGHKVDVIKPTGWEGPKTMGILLAHGYDPESMFDEEHYRDDPEHIG